MSMTYLKSMRAAAIDAVKNGQENLVLPSNISRQTCELFIRSLNCELEPQFGAVIELDDGDTQRMWMNYLHGRPASNRGVVQDCMNSAERS